MAREAVERLALPAEVLHELAGQLDGVPFDAVDARHRRPADLGQQVVQAVAELVEQGDDVVVGQQAGAALDGRRGVAGEVGHGDLAGEAEPRAADVHPRAAALALAGVVVEVHAGTHAAIGIEHVEVLHVRMPGRDVQALAEAHAEHVGGDVEHALEHAGQREVGLELLLLEGVARDAQLLAGPADVPGLEVVQAQLAGGERAQLVQFALRDRPRLGGEFAQEGEHAFRRAGHLVFERLVRGTREAEQLRGFMAQREDLRDARRVVVLAGLRPLVGGAGVVGRVDGFAQRAVVGVGQDRLHHRPLQRGEEAVLPLGFRLARQQVARRGRQAGELCLGQRQRPGLGGVEHGLLERRVQLRELGLDLAETRARRLLERDAGIAEAAQAVLDEGALRAIQRGESGALAHGLHGFIKAAVLAELGGELGDALVGFRVHLAQLGRVLHPVQVRHRRPGARELFVEPFERRDQRIEVAGGGIGDEALDGGAVVGQHGFDGGHDVRGLEGGEIRQQGRREQGIRGGVHAARMGATLVGDKRRPHAACAPSGAFTPRPSASRGCGTRPSAAPPRGARAPARGRGPARSGRGRTASRGRRRRAPGSGSRRRRPPARHA